MVKKKSDDNQETTRIELDYPVELDGVVYRGVLEVDQELADKLKKQEEIK